MLADSKQHTVHLGLLGRNVQKSATFLNEIIHFIAEELPRWRDNLESSYRAAGTSETVLTSRLCAHLNSAARRANGWDILQFRPEEPDERAKGRKVDVAAAPCDAILWVEQRRYLDSDTLLPIECKRLPTPREKDRDEREYVFSAIKSTGGIQRFKAGHHGGNHGLAAMIGYIQRDTCASWYARITEWINDLVSSREKGWTEADLLSFDRHDAARQMASLRSAHTRGKDVPVIELHHLWIQMC